MYMPKKIEKNTTKRKSAKTRSEKKFKLNKLLQNKNFLIIAAVILLTLVSIPVFLSSALPQSQKNASDPLPSITSNSDEVTITPSPTTTQKTTYKTIPTATPTSSPTPTPKGVMTVRGHFVDENLQPFTHPGLNVRAYSERTKEEKQTSEQPHWVFKLQTPADLIFTVPNIAGYTAYVTHSSCFGENACMPVVEKNTSCIESECNKNPDSWKARFRYAGYNNDNVLYLVLHPEQTAEIYFMYKKY